MKKIIIGLFLCCFLITICGCCDTQPKFCGFKLGANFDTSKGIAETWNEEAEKMGGKKYTIKKGNFLKFLDFDNVYILTSSDNRIISITAACSGLHKSNFEAEFKKACDAIEGNFGVSSNSNSKVERVYYIDKEEDTYFYINSAWDRELGGFIWVTLQSRKLKTNAISTFKKSKSDTSAFK